jgi:hypothetical protein
MADYLIKDVKEFRLRTKNALMTIGVTSTSHLAKLSARDLKCIYGIGNKGFKSILDFCFQNNIMLGQKS